MEWARLLHGKVHGTRPVGRPIKELQLDNIRDDYVDMGTTIIEATQWTANRSQWRCIISIVRRHRLRRNGHK